MHVVDMPLDRLRPAPYNPRVDLERTDPRYRKLRRSIEQFGLVEPLVWNRRTGYVVGGHQRLKILRELGHSSVPVSVVDLGPAEERILNIILNNREAQSDFDAARLREVLDDLDRVPGFDLGQTGFDRRCLAMLRQEMEPVPLPSRAEVGPRLIEVVLVVTMEQYDALRTEIDPLIQRRRIECHVRFR